MLELPAGFTEVDSGLVATSFDGVFTGLSSENFGTADSIATGFVCLTGWKSSVF